MADKKAEAIWRAKNKWLPKKLVDGSRFNLWYFGDTRWNDPCDEWIL